MKENQMRPHWRCFVPPLSLELYRLGYGGGGGGAHGRRSDYWGHGYDSYWGFALPTVRALPRGEAATGSWLNFSFM